MHGKRTKSYKQAFIHFFRKQLPFLVAWFIVLAPLPLLLLIVKKIFGIIVVLIIVAATISFLRSFVKEILDKAIRKKQRSTSSNAGSYLHIVLDGTNDISRVIRANRVYAVIILVFLEIFPATAFAALIPVGPPIYPIFMSSPSGIGLKENELDSPNNNEASLMPDAPPADSSIAPVNENTATSEQTIDKSSCPSLISSEDAQFDLRHMELEDPGRIFVLQESTTDNLMFRTGRWHIANDADSTSAALILADFIHERSKIQRVDSFSSRASGKLQKDVASASNAIINSSRDLDKTLAIQENAWNEGFDNFTLTKLIGNSYYGYGLAYYDNGTIPATAKSYLLLSIQWRFLSLEYEETNSREIRKVLSRISQAYRDISTISDLSPADRQRAKLLADAFEIVKKDYK